MGLFGKSRKPLDSRFELAKVSSRQCTKVILPSMYQMPMLNPLALGRIFQEGASGDALVKRVMESEEYWRDRGVDVDQLAYGVAKLACRLEGLDEDESIVTECFVLAKMGLLMGLFERASGTTSSTDCHPEMWNSLVLMARHSDDRESRKTLPENSALLYSTTAYAAYVLGKMESMTLEKLFVNWR